MAFISPFSLSCICNWLLLLVLFICSCFFFLLGGLALLLNRIVSENQVIGFSSLFIAITFVLQKFPNVMTFEFRHCNQFKHVFDEFFGKTRKMLMNFRRKSNSPNLSNKIEHVKTLFTTHRTKSAAKLIMKNHRSQSNAIGLESPYTALNRFIFNQPV